MVNSKHTDLICTISMIMAAVILTLIMAGCSMFDNVEPVNLESEQLDKISFEYQDTLFDDSYVHEIDILINNVNWDYTTKNATDEIYVECSVMIDGEKIDGVAIRPKGNSSLASISKQGSDRFSFKIKFDHYTTGKTFDGLDKLSLNNLGQDTSCMKDYLTYHMMNFAGIPAPLSSYTNVKLNGEDFGLYLAVECLEESFAQRNYGKDHGNLFKPDRFGVETMDMSVVMNTEGENAPINDIKAVMTGEKYRDFTPGNRVDILGELVAPTFMAMGVNTDDAALKYIDDQVESYKNVFNTAVFDMNKKDKEQFISGVKQLNTSDTPQEALYVDDVLKYFAVNSFANNYDGYTSFFVHNFYLYEKDGKFAMVPWDYNLGYGAFTYESAIQSFLGDDTDINLIPDTGNAMDINKSMINFPIDTPVFSIDMQDRPILNQLIKQDEYLQLYHKYYNEFIAQFFESGYFETLYNNTLNNITPYVQKGETFYTYEQFAKGTSMMKKYCDLRSQSIRGQLEGQIPSTTEGQILDYNNLVNTEGLNIADTIDFSGLAVGIEPEEIPALLDVIMDEDAPRDISGVVQSIQTLAMDKSKLKSTVTGVLSTSKMVQNMIIESVIPYMILILSFVLLFVAIKRLKNCSRRKDKKHEIQA